jgi:DNA-binding response OmpR family regulator
MAGSSRILCIGPALDHIIHTLRQNSYEVMAATSFQSARALSRLFPPSAIVVDATEPDLLRQMKFSCPEVPVLPISCGWEDQVVLDNISTVLQAQLKSVPAS